MGQAGHVAAEDQDRWAEAVRRQLAAGRVLLLGGPSDEGLWITEAAVAAALRRSASAAGLGVRLGDVRIVETGHIEAGFAAPPGPPLRELAERLRGVLWETAEGVGLRVSGVDLQVTELLDARAPGVAAGDAPIPGPPPAGLPVPGVAEVATVLGGRYAGWKQIAVAAGHRAVDVARAVRAATSMDVLVTEAG